MNYYTRIALITCLFPVMSWAEDAETPQAPAAPVKVEKAQRDTFSATLWVSGTVISQNDARIAAETDGRITWVADVGSRIEQGEAVARIDAEDLRLELADNFFHLNELTQQTFLADRQNFVDLFDAIFQCTDRVIQTVLFVRERAGETVRQRFECGFKLGGDSVVLVAEECLHRVRCCLDDIVEDVFVELEFPTFSRSDAQTRQALQRIVRAEVRLVDEITQSSRNS